MTVVVVEVENRSGAEVDEAAAVELAQRVLAAEGIDGLGWVHLSSSDVVRHRIVQDIVDAYERATPPSKT